MIALSSGSRFSRWYFAGVAGGFLDPTTHGGLTIPNVATSDTKKTLRAYPADESSEEGHPSEPDTIATLARFATTGEPA
jgi:hypothetical protein